MKRIFTAVFAALLALAVGAQVTTNPGVTGVPAPQSAVAITGGSINGTPIGQTTPAAGAFTTLSGTNLTLTTALTNNGGAGTLTWPAAGATLTIPTGGGTLGTGAFATIANYLPLAGGTMTGNLIFTDNTYDIGANGATRPRTGYFGTSVYAPLLGALGASTSMSISPGQNGEAATVVGMHMDSGATALSIRMNDGGYYYPFRLLKDGTYTFANNSGANTVGISSTGALAVTSTISTGASASTGTAVIIDGSNILRPLTSSERFKDVVQRNWTPSAKQAASFLSVGPILFNYKDQVETEEERTFIGDDGKPTKRKVKRGENLPGVKGVLGFSAEELDAAGIREAVNYDKDGKPLSIRDHAIMAYMLAIIKDQSARIAKLEAKQ